MSRRRVKALAQLSPLRAHQRRATDGLEDRLWRGGGELDNCRPRKMAVHSPCLVPSSHARRTSGPASSPEPVTNAGGPCRRLCAVRRRHTIAAADTQITITRIPVYQAVSYRRGLRGMPRAQVTVPVVKHAVIPGEKYGKLTIIAEVRKVAPGGQGNRAVRCRCDCGSELTTALRSVMSGDARSCGCSRGRPKYGWKRCPVCGRRARIRRDRRSCSRACGHKLTGAALRAERPSYDVWHNRVKKARGPASDCRCVDCGGPAQDWSTADRSGNDVRVRFQPRCRKCHRRYDLSSRIRLNSDYAEDGVKPRNHGLA
jgi:hypothetical protein